MCFLCRANSTRRSNMTLRCNFGLPQWDVFSTHDFTACFWKTAYVRWDDAAVMDSLIGNEWTRRGGRNEIEGGPAERKLGSGAQNEMFGNLRKPKQLPELSRCHLSENLNVVIQSNLFYLPSVHLLVIGERCLCQSQHLPLRSFVGRSPGSTSHTNNYVGDNGQSFGGENGALWVLLMDR